MRDQGPVNSDSELDKSVEPKVVNVPLRAPSEVVGPQGESAHECCENGASGKGRRTEDQFQLPHPDNLVNESAYAGQQEAEEDHPGKVPASTSLYPALSDYLAQYRSIRNLIFT